ncbi:MAG TPA: hypothetical protein VF669_04370 [Tepidisphaeraceae bacterium]
MPDFIPSREDAFVIWAQTFSAYVSAHAVALGLLAGDATALGTLLTNFVNAKDLTDDPATRTPVGQTAKAVAKAALIADIRSLAKRIQANPAVTAQQKTALGLPIHNATPTPTPVPATQPQVSFVGFRLGAIDIAIVDSLTPQKKARPVGTIGAEVYSFVIAAPNQTVPDDLEQWRFEGLATKNSYTLDFDSADGGKEVVIVARWINRKGEAGPTSVPVTAQVMRKMAA